MRATKVRRFANMLPVESVKKRKQFFAKEKEGLLSYEIQSNPMAAFSNPDMMGNMLKGSMFGMF